MTQKECQIIPNLKLIALKMLWKCQQKYDFYFYAIFYAGSFNFPRITLRLDLFFSYWIFYTFNIFRWNRQTCHVFRTIVNKNASFLNFLCSLTTIVLISKVFFACCSFVSNITTKKSCKISWGFKEVLRVHDLLSDSVLGFATFFIVKLAVAVQNAIAEYKKKKLPDKKVVNCKSSMNEKCNSRI